MKQALELETTKDYKQLSECYREIAKYFYKQKDKVKNEEYLAKSRVAKEKIPVKENQLINTDENQFKRILALPNSYEKYVLLEKFRNRFPGYTQPYFELGSLANNLKMYEKAKMYFELFIKFNDVNDNVNNAYAYNNLGVLLVRNEFKQYDLAKKHYEKSIELNAENAPSYYNYATLLTSDYFKDYNLAKKYFEKAIELKPDYLDAHQGLADLSNEK